MSTSATYGGHKTKTTAEFCMYVVKGRKTGNTLNTVLLTVKHFSNNKH